MNLQFSKILMILTAIGLILFLLFSIFSYSLTAPNLVITGWSPYWNFQTYMWDTFFNNRQLLSQVFFGLAVALFGWYFLYIWNIKKSIDKKAVRFISLRAFILISALLFIAPLMISSTALSYDVYNYMFNAKMITIYDANPHVQTAISFPNDEWIRFMHNVHTPAPYGYGWTLLSLVPYFMGQSSFVLTWLSFRVFMLLSLISLVFVLLFTSSKKNIWLIGLVAFHPLLLIEVISSVHNDLWMMTPAVLALALQSKYLSFTQTKDHKKWMYVIGISFVLLLVSISIKLATIAVIPVWILLSTAPWIAHLWEHKATVMKKIKSNTLIQLAHTYYTSALNNWAVIASILLFLPLLIERSKWFLPWYILWSLVWIPLFNMKHKISIVWTSWLLAISTSSFFRYLPYLQAGEYSQVVTFNQIVITWLGAILLFPGLYYFVKKAML